MKFLFKSNKKVNHNKVEAMSVINVGQLWKAIRMPLRAARKSLMKKKRKRKK